jgi:hypothetical protein
MIDLILGVLCEVRAEAHYEKHGGLFADSAYHVSQGERPTCGAEETPQTVSSPDETSDEGKSRYCRKRWFC